MELLAEVWQRATSTQPPPPTSVVALSALIAAVLVSSRRTWPLTRLAVTITHEGAHAVAALLTGRRLRGIRMHTDTSGVTVSSGPPTGPGMVVTLLAGYLGPALVGLGAAGLLLAGYSLGLLWLWALLLAAMLLQIRNAYGLLVLGVAVAGLVAASWYLSAAAQSTLAYLLTWLLLLAAPRPVVELMGDRRRGRVARSDVDQMGRLTRVPGGAWAAFFLVANCAGLAAGSLLLVPALADLGARVADRL